MTHCAERRPDNLKKTDYHFFSTFVQTKFPIISAFGRKNWNLVGKPPTAGRYFRLCLITFLTRTTPSTQIPPNLPRKENLDSESPSPINPVTFAVPVTKRIGDPSF
jgi:hypothetical protein